MAGASPTSAPRPCASSTATRISARPSPWRSTARSSANRWSRVRSPRSIPAACPRAPASTTAQSTVYYPFDLEGAKALLEKAGLKDTDGNGFVNFPAGTAGGADVEIVLLVNSDYGTDRNLAEGVVGQMEKLGLKVVLNAVDGTKRDATQYAGRFDWLVRRNDQELTSVVQNTTAACSDRPAHQLAPPGRNGRDGRSDALRAGAGRHRQQVHRQQRQ